MRRLVTFLRQPAVLLPVLFLTLTGFLGNWLTPEPRFVIRTGAVHDQYDQHRHKLGQVADDGGQVVILDQYMTENGLSTMFHNYWDPEWPIYRTRPTWWATHSATDETPRWWSDEAWVEHLPRFGDWQMPAFSPTDPEESCSWTKGPGWCSCSVSWPDGRWRWTRYGPRLSMSMTGKSPTCCRGRCALVPTASMSSTMFATACPSTGPCIARPICSPVRWSSRT